MLKSAEKTGTNEYTLLIAAEAEAFNAAVNKVYNKQKNSINVPGFRKGKAPSTACSPRFTTRPWKRPASIRWTSPETSI